MDALYSKLYKKYTELKNQKFAEQDQYNKDQKAKFWNFVTASEDVFHYLQKENDRLTSEVVNLRNELAFVRSAKDEQHIEYQKHLEEENRKNKKLSEEIEWLKGNGHVSGGAGTSLKGRNSNKRKRHSGSGTEHMGMPISSPENNEIQGESAKDPDKEAACRGSLVTSQKPQCWRNFDGPGGSVTSTAKCLFQVLSEYMLGLKFSVVDQTDNICISAVHPLSGYTFSLTWVNGGAGEEAELLYTTLSLGTFEKEAPEWMKEEMMFSTTMSRIFFERVSKVVNLS